MARSAGGPGDAGPIVPRRSARKPPPRSGAVTGFAVGLLVGLSAVALDARLYGNPPQPHGVSAGRGASPANSPTEISPRGWRDVLKRTWSEFNSDHITAVAGGATFFGLLALFPALGVFVSLYGLFADVEQARQHVLALQGVLPGGAISVLSEQMQRLAAAPHGRLGLTFAMSLLLSLWSANAGIKALIAGLNVAYEETERRKFVQLNLVSLGFTVSAVALALAAAALPAGLSRLGLQGSLVVRALQWPVLLVVIVAALSVLYRYAPCREHARWRWITPGSAVAAILWVMMSMLFTLYVANFGHYDKTYGSLGAVVGFMTWIWLSLTVVLLGAELNSELEQQTSADTTTGPPRPPGQRGAAVAD